MKKLIFTWFAFTVSVYSFAQITFEKGYFINEDNTRISCLIKNVDWHDNPVEFEYKLPNSEVIQIGSINKVSEFGIIGTSKYQRFIVQMDRASHRDDKLETSKNLDFREERQFLKVLVEGSASLYKFVDDNLIRYFFKTDALPIEQLVYKPYKTDNYELKHNNQFRQQLFNYLKCDAITMQQIENLDYKEKPLVNLFIKFNTCVDPSFEVKHDHEKKNLLHLSLRPGLNFSTLKAQSSYTDISMDFGYKLGIRVGLEFELVMPFNKNKWALVVEPTYQGYKSQTEYTYITTHEVVADYNTLDFSIGIRYYSFLNEESKLFFNTSLILGYAFSSAMYIPDRKEIFDASLSTESTLAVGVGYSFKRKYSVELRYEFSRELLGEYVYWSSDYSGPSFIVGYKLF